MPNFSIAASLYLFCKSQNYCLVFFALLIKKSIINGGAILEKMHYICKSFCNIIILTLSFNY